MLSSGSGPPLHLSGRVGGGKLCTCWASGRSGVSEVGERGGEGQLVGLLLCHSSSHSWKLNLRLARFLSGDGDFLKQEFS